MANVGYARVSTVEQDLTMQLDALKQADCGEIFSGKQSGASKQNEEKLNELLSYIRKGDVVIVTKLDRLGRSLKAVLATIEAIHTKGATLRTLDNAINTSWDIILPYSISNSTYILFYDKERGLSKTYVITKEGGLGDKIDENISLRKTWGIIAVY